MADNFVALKIRATDEARPDLDDLKLKLDELKGRVAEARAEVSSAEADRTLADLDAKLDMVSKKVARPNIDLAGASRAAASITAVEADLDGLDAKAASAAAEQEAAAAKSAGAAEASGNRWAGAGEKAKLALLGVGVGAALAIGGAASFQAQTVRLVTSAGESAKNLGLVRQGMLGIAAQTATSTGEMASGMYTIESAGFHGAAGLKVLKSAAQGAKDEGADLATVSNAVTDALVDFHQPASKAADVTSQLIAAVSHGKTTFEEFSGSMSTVLPLANSLHLKLADVTGVLAEMTAHGMSARQAADDEANAMNKLMAPSGTMVKEYKALGISAAQVHDKLGTAGLGGTMEWLSQVAHKGAAAVGQNYTEALYKLMGTTPALKTALMTTGENADATEKAIHGIAGASADAKGNVDGFSAVSQTMSFKLAAAKESVIAAGISLGQVLLPAATAVLTPLTHLLQSIAGNKAEAIAFSLVVGGVLAAVVGVKAVHAFHEMESAAKDVGEGVQKLAEKLLGLGKSEEKAAAASKKASAESAGAAEKGAAEQEAASGEAAAAAEADATATAAANEEAAAESSGSWITAAGQQVAAAATAAAQQAAKVAVAVASSVAGAATTAAAWVASGAQQAAGAAVWAAQAVAKVAVIVAGNVAGAAVSMAAWVAANAVMLLGIGLIVVAVVAAVLLIVKHWKQISDAAKEAFHLVLAVVDSVIDWIKGHWPLLLAILAGPIGLAVLLIVKHWKQIQHGAEEAIGWVRSHWPLILAILTGPIGLAVLLIKDHWHQITAGAADVVHDVASFFGDLRHDVVSIIDQLGADLFNAGKRVVSMLANGIKAAAGEAMGAISSVVDEVKSFLPFSPAKKGPLSGAGAPENSGRSIGRQLAQGLVQTRAAAADAARQLARAMASGDPLTIASAKRLAEQVTAHYDHLWHRLHELHEEHLKDLGIGSATAGSALGSAGGYGYGGGAPQQMEIVLRVEPSGNKVMDAIVDGLKVEVRSRGGGGKYSVQKALGREWPTG